MKPIPYIDRQSGKRELEEVYGGKAVDFLYGEGWLPSMLGRPVSHLAGRLSFVSRLYGWAMHQPWSVKKIRPFIEHYHIDTNEFLDDVDSFRSFNDFFIRKLKPAARPIAAGEHIAVIPADGRYRFYQNIDAAHLHDIKGRKLDLAGLVGDYELARQYTQGSLLLARLCPTDYHRYHFPVDCIPSSSRLLNGCLYSVNPVAIRQNIRIFSENKRMVCRLQSPQFGEVLFIDIGATNVGSIHQTYQPRQPYSKGAEKGFFAFGGSALAIVFLPGAVQFDKDLTQAMSSGLEVRCLMGQSLGTSATRGA